jgi:hypothetical protein
MLPIPRTLSLDHLRESLAALFDRSGRREAAR